MEENENSKTDTVLTVVKTTAAVVTTTYVAVIAAKGLYDLATDWKDVIKEKRQAKKAQKES